MRWFYRGRHHTNRHSVTVADLLGEYDWHLTGRAFVIRSLLSVDSLLTYMGRTRSVICTGARRARKPIRLPDGGTRLWWCAMTANLPAATNPFDAGHLQPVGEYPEVGPSPIGAMLNAANKISGQAANVEQLRDENAELSCRVLELTAERDDLADRLVGLKAASDHTLGLFADAKRDLRRACSENARLVTQRDTARAQLGWETSK